MVRPSRIKKCNKLFQDPTRSPTTGLPITEKTQRKYMRRCHMPIKDTVVYFAGAGRKVSDVRKRVLKAGGQVVKDEESAIYVVDDDYKGSESAGKFVLSLEMFVSLFKLDLYSECERFNMDPTRSPVSGLKIREGGVQQQEWMRKCQGKIAQAVEKETRESLLKRVQRMCINDVEPVTLDKIAELEEERLRRIVMIGAQEQRKHCLLADSAYGVYERAVRNGKDPKNPLNPAHVFTDEEITQILKVTRRPEIVKRSDTESSLLKLRLEAHTIGRDTYNRVVIAMPFHSGGEYEIYSMGYIPKETRIVQALRSKLDDGAIVKIDAAHGHLVVNPRAAALRMPIEYWTKGGSVEEYIKSLQIIA